MSTKTGDEVVTAREFDITQFVKKLGVSIGVLAGAAAAALKLFKVEQITPGIVAAALGVTAVALLGVCFVSAVDIAARAYVTRGNADDPDPSPKSGGDGDDAATPLTVGAVPQKMLAWLEGESQPRLVLAMAGDGEKSKFLLSGSKIGERDRGDDLVQSLEGSPSWYEEKKVRAVRAAGLP
jgi:hypothetical protein